MFIYYLWIVKIISVLLFRIKEQMTAYATAVARGHGPNLSEICIARCPDGKWYRAACLDVIPDPGNHVNVFFYVNSRRNH